MLWLWLYHLWRGIRALIWLPAAQPQRIDVNAACPACGAAQGCLVAVQPTTIRSEAGVREPVLVQHICKVCGARWHEKTIVEDRKAELIFPADITHLASLQPNTKDIAV